MSVNEKLFAVKPNGLSLEQQETIDKLIEHFKEKSPSELELLTTAIYAYNHLKDRSVESVIRGVRKIKGEKYSVKQIRESSDDFAYSDRSFA